MAKLIQLEPPTEAPSTNGQVIDLNDRVRNRIAELEAEVQQYIRQAEAQVAAYHAVIGELKKLLEGNPDAAP